MVGLASISIVGCSWAEKSSSARSVPSTVQAVAAVPAASYSVHPPSSAVTGADATACSAYLATTALADLNSVLSLYERYHLDFVATFTGDSATAQLQRLEGQKSLDRMRELPRVIAQYGAQACVAQPVRYRACITVGHAGPVADVLATADLKAASMMEGAASLGRASALLYARGSASTSLIAVYGFYWSCWHP
jgi:hypothetical protein